MAVLRDVVFDCARPSALAAFWAAALDGHAIAPYDEAELARLRALGVHDVADDPSVLVEGPPGTAPRYFFTLVPERKAVKNRVHLDLDATDVDAEAERLVGLGATVLARHEDHVTLADPEGNEFCLMRT